MVSFCTIKRYNKQKGADHMSIKNLNKNVYTDSTDLKNFVIRGKTALLIP